MFNKPTNKVETTTFFQHLAIFDLLSDMILHMEQFCGLVRCKTFGEEVLKLCTLCSIKLFWHGTIAPSCKNTARKNVVAELGRDLMWAY